MCGWSLESCCVCVSDKPEMLQITERAGGTPMTSRELRRKRNQEQLARSPSSLHSLTPSASAFSQPHFLLAESCLLLSHSVLSNSLWLLWTVARQALLPMEFPRQGYWSGLPCPLPRDLLDPGIEQESLALAGRFFTTNAA